jgi:hypothetical protein
VLAWLWTRYQPGAAQVCWFRERVGYGTAGAAFQNVKFAVAPPLTNPWPRPWALGWTARGGVEFANIAELVGEGRIPRAEAWLSASLGFRRGRHIIYKRRLVLDSGGALWPHSVKRRAFGPFARSAPQHPLGQGAIGVDDGSKIVVSGGEEETIRRWNARAPFCIV